MKVCKGTALDDAPGAVAGAAAELARQSAAELGQHQIDGLGCDLQQFGREWPRHERPRQEQLDQPRQLRVAAALPGEPGSSVRGRGWEA